MTVWQARADLAEALVPTAEMLAIAVRDADARHVAELIRDCPSLPALAVVLAAMVDVETRTRQELLGWTDRLPVRPRQKTAPWSTPALRLAHARWVAGERSSDVERGEKQYQHARYLWRHRAEQQRIAAVKVGTCGTGVLPTLPAPNPNPC